MTIGIIGAGKIVIDASIEAPLCRPMDPGGRTSTDVLASFVAGARVVKAFIHLTPKPLPGSPQPEGGRRVLFQSGDDARAKGAVAAVIGRIGFLGTDPGSLSAGSRLVQFPGGPLPAIHLVKFG